MNDGTGVYEARVFDLVEIAGNLKPGELATIAEVEPGGRVTVAGGNLIVESGEKPEVTIDVGEVESESGEAEILKTVGELRIALESFDDAMEIRGTFDSYDLPPHASLILEERNGSLWIDMDTAR